MLRLNKAINKFLFCYSITRDSNSFFKLLWNTKKFKWKQAATSSKAYYNVEEKYNLAFNQQTFQVFLRTFSGDIAIFYEIFWNKVYQLPVECYKNANTIVDLGANIGLATLYFRHQCKNAFIYSVEPEESNFKMLLKNLKSGIIKKNIIPLHAAIDSKDGEASIQINGLLYNSTIIAANENSALVRTISMKTLCNRFNINRIDILKIDIEGTEKRLFEEDIDWLEKVKYLLIEFHSDAIKAFCIEILVSKSFMMHPIKTFNKNSRLFWAVNNSVVSITN
jgi:FkbM family methyltransferase